MRTLVGLSALFACDPAEETEGHTDSEAANNSSTNTQETSVPWVPTCDGIVYFLDGFESNSCAICYLSKFTDMEVEIVP